MNVNLKYFGAIAEAVKKDSETLTLGEKSSVNDFSEFIESIYPQLQGFIFKIAVNQNITEENIELSENDEIALLPPFAGG